jgi:hypothetical protein
MRVTKLDVDGNVLNETGNSYVSDKAVTINFNPNIETGNTFSRRNGCGCSLARFKSKDVFNWWEFTFEDGALEPELEAMMLNEETIVDGTDVVGVAFGGQDLSCEELEQGVALEFWTKHINGSGLDSFHRYIHWVFPLTVWQRGDNSAEEDFMANQLTGFSRTNPMWGQGPYGDGPPDGQDISEGGYWKTNDDLPTAACVSDDVEPGS